MRITFEMLNRAKRHALISLCIQWASWGFFLGTIIHHNIVEGGAKTLMLIAMIPFFLTIGITWALIERYKRMINKKCDQTKYRWDTIESTRDNWRNN